MKQNHESIIKDMNEIKGKAKKFAKKFGAPIPLIEILNSDEQWEVILGRLDSWGLRIAKKGKKQ